MPTSTFYLDDTRTEPLTATWGLFFRNFTVSHAGTPLEPTNPEASLAQGRQYRLPDGRIFSARHKQNTYPQELELLIDGQPVPGSGTHPNQRMKQAWYVLLILGILNIGLGLVTEFGHIEALAQLGAGWGSLVEGTAYIALGYFGYFRTSAPCKGAGFPEQQQASRSAATCSCEIGCSTDVMSNGFSSRIFSRTLAGVHASLASMRISIFLPTRERIAPRRSTSFCPSMPTLILSCLKL